MKPIVIRFSPEHERRLRRLCIKKQFLKNISAHGQDAEKFALLSIKRGDSWYDLINSAFFWLESPEGHDYWENIANLKTRKKKS